MSKKLPTLPRGSLSIKCLNLSRDSSLPRQNKTRDKLGYLDTAYIFSGEVETLSWYLSDAIIMKFLSEQLVLKLCQINCVMRKFETFV